MDFKELVTSSGIADADAFINSMKANNFHISSEENADIRLKKEREGHLSTKAQLAEAQKRIEELTATQTTNEADKVKIELLEKTLKDERISSKLKLALMKEKATDVDYLIFKLKEKGELNIDDKGEIAELTDKLSGLKTQFPNMFENGSSDSDKKFKEKNLKDTDSDTSMTKEKFDRLSYKERVKLKNEHPEVYDSFVKN